MALPVEDWIAAITGSLTNKESTFELTDWSLSQVCNKLGPTPLAYMRACPPNLRATNLNHWLANPHNNGGDWFIRTDGERVRAVLSTQYTPIANTQVLQSAVDVIGDVKHRLSRPVVTPDYMNLTILVNENGGHGPDGNYGIGARITNGETGNRAVRVDPVIKRDSCDNSIAITDGGWEQRHVHVSPAFIFGAIKEKLGMAVRLSVEALDAIVRAEAINIPNFGDVVDELARDKGLTEATADLIKVGSEGALNRMGIVNGLSFAAKEVDDHDLTYELENLAGAILVQGDNVFAQRVMEVQVR
jgi:hypothetical protein